MAFRICRAASTALASLLLCVAIGAAKAQSPRPSLAKCDPAKLPVAGFDECLRKAEAETSKGVEDTLAKVKAAIDARADLSGQQRNLLKREISNSNDLWARYRNDLCQNIVPMLAGPKAKLFEENLGCLVDTNTARQAELEALILRK
ncbi:MAG: hypothetical protein JO137_06085 [Hyphomicrobiales bacterium]|nr:hypothetical protein [Hyphomicrobiales bacterium]MBV8766223.1 hypothetical protein [Hyphomicrobiales bacterium]MBV9431375.1 hypothetical protein [Hyphomicrobiales bacterium]MBV9739307.1 hypothetical protein [Hyphomicrobiales bacterium]MBW0003443.1 hypothetical protein [Hyphomicrobiales bacterium]